MAGMMVYINTSMTAMRRIYNGEMRMKPKLLRLLGIALNPLTIGAVAVMVSLIIGLFPDSGYNFVNCEDIALKSSDFPHAVNTLASENFSSSDLPLELYDLGLPDAVPVMNKFVCGYYTWHLEPPELDERGEIIPYGLQQGAESWVLVFETPDAAKEAYNILTEPKSSGSSGGDGMPIVWTGEQEISWFIIGDESRVTEYEICSEGDEYVIGCGWCDCTKWYTVTALEDNVLVRVYGDWPSQPSYFTSLAIIMVNRSY